MKSRILIGVCIAMLLSGPVQAQLFQVPGGMSNRLIRTTMEELATLPALEAAVTKQVYAAARINLAGTGGLLWAVPPGIVQIKLPNHRDVIGTGFLFEKNGQLFVGMANHIGGKEGSIRKVQVFSSNGVPQEYLVTIGASGNSGWHAADISIARLPYSALKQGAIPLTLGYVNMDLPVYSLGYTSGALGQYDLLPLVGKFSVAEGYGLQSSRELIFGESAEEPFLFSGYCGSPVLQQHNGQWQVVGVYVGACVVPGRPEKNKSFAVNISKAMPFLLDAYFHHKLPDSRSLFFKGWPVGRLAWQECVSAIQVVRNGEVVFERRLRNYTGPYSDERSEMALEDFETSSGDILRYTIRISRGKPRHVEFVLP